ncbi:MAG: MFS transporter [Cyanobacteria bacterium]|jgi:MFS family permease|nr:MFS transporter [Cyanobacteria bacterium GSL.Bin21]
MVNPSLIKKTKIVLFFESAFPLEVFFAPTMIAFYTSYVQISFKQMSIIFSVILVSTWVLEVPSGIFSDWVGRKKAFLLGKSIYLAAMISLFFIKSFQLLLITAIIFSLGSAITSGNLSSISYENIVSISNKEKYLEINSKAHSVSFISAAIASVAGGYFGNIDLRLPLIIDSFLLGFTIFISLIYLKESRCDYSIDFTRFGAGLIKPFKSIFIDGMIKILESKYILLIIVFNAIVFSLVRTGFNFYQPIVEDVNVNLAFFGIILAGLNIVAALSSFAFSSFPIRYIDHRVLMGLTIFLIILSAITIMIGSNYVFPVIFTFALHQILRGFVKSYVQYSLNTEIPEGDRSRTTILSVSFLITAISGAIFMALSGFLVEKYGLIFSFAAISIMSALCILLNYILLLSKKEA